MIINKKIFVDYFLMILLIALSGVPYLISPKLSILQFLILLSIFFIRKIRINMSFIFLFTFLFFITLLQGLKFSFFPIVTNVGLFILVLSAYLTVKIVERNFVKYYVNILYYISIISLLVYFPTLLFPSIGKFLIYNISPIFNIFNFANSERATIIIYNLSHIDIFRNSGPFWEPGAFAGYLLLAFMFNFLQNSQLSEKKNRVFLLAIITTLSTTTYLAMFIFFFFIYFKKIKNILFKVGIVVGIVVAVIYAYNTFDFLGKKIEAQLKVAREQGIQRSNDTQRFLSILRDMHSLRGYEFTGRGGNNQTRYDLSYGGKFIIPTVGLTDIIVRYGIPFFILMLYFLYYSVHIYMEQINYQSRLYSLGFIVALLTTLLSEMYFNYSVFWSLLFLRYAYVKKEKRG